MTPEDRTVDMLWEALAPDSDVWLRLWSVTFPAEAVPDEDAVATDPDDEKAALVRSVADRDDLVTSTADGTVVVPMQALIDAASGFSGDFTPETAGELLLKTIGQVRDAGG